MTPPRTRLRLIAIPLLAALTLTACEGDPGQDGTRNSGHSNNADGRQNRSTPKLDPGIFVRPVNATFNVGPNHVVTSTTITGNGTKRRQTVESHVGKKPDTSVTNLVTDGSHAQARRIGGKGWLRSQAPQIRSALPKGKSWVRMSGDQLAKAGIPTIVDQLSMLYVLRGAHSIRDTGTAKVEGVPTDRYRFDINLHQAVCAAPADQRDNVEALLTPREGTQASLSARVWIDDYHLVRRLRVTATIHGVGETTYELRIPGDNSTQNVRKPPKNKTVPLSQTPKLAKLIPADQAGTSTSC